MFVSLQSDSDLFLELMERDLAEKKDYQDHNSGEKKKIRDWKSVLLKKKNISN